LACQLPLPKLYAPCSHRAAHCCAQATCREYKIPYNSYATFGELYMSHVRTLRDLGRGQPQGQGRDQTAKDTVKPSH
jgi:hypothetical protein